MSAPLPTIAMPHWEGAARGELLLPHCGACGHVWYPPARHCPACLSDAIAWRAVDGQGVIAGVCVFHRPYFRDSALPLPYTVLHIRLDAGPQLYANPEDVQAVPAIGARVAPVFVPAGDGQALVRFRVVRP